MNESNENMVYVSFMNAKVEHVMKGVIRLGDKTPY
jgi:hypothetical protein